MNAPLLRLAPAQLHAALWNDARLHVHAVLRGQRLPGLMQRLAQSGPPDHDCLRPGALSAQEAAQATWLARLAPQAEFTDWVLGTAAAVAPDWGVLVLAPGRFLDVRAHLRRLGQARLPDGQAIELDWADPTVLALLLARLEAAQLDALFGPLSQWLVPAAGGWMRWQAVAGQLHGERIELAA